MTARYMTQVSLCEAIFAPPPIVTWLPVTLAPDAKEQELQLTAPPLIIYTSHESIE